MRLGIVRLAIIISPQEVCLLVLRRHFLYMEGLDVSMCDLELM